MSEQHSLVFETTLEAPIEKVWRALTITEYRDRWLQRPDDVEVETIAVNANSLLTIRWIERPDANTAQSEESVVTIELTPYENGTTGFRLTHAPPVTFSPANSNETIALAA